MDGPDPIFFGAVGLAAGTGIAAWVEWFLLRRVLRGKIGTVGAGTGPLGRMALAALAAAAVAWGVRMLVPVIHPIPYAVVILGAFGLIYVGVAYALGVEEARAWTRRIKSVTARLTR
jgi:putative peptidoglycan lipid II flippase